MYCRPCLQNNTSFSKHQNNSYIDYNPYSTHTKTGMAIVEYSGRKWKRCHDDPDQIPASEGNPNGMTGGVYYLCKNQRCGMFLCWLKDRK